MKRPGYTGFFYTLSAAYMYKIAIIGGGPAGLTAAIHLSREGEEVMLFEKQTYPHHKVCGEFLSNEIVPYFEKLNIPLQSLGPKGIQRLVYTHESGKTLEAELPLGGLGISRYALDHLLYQKALENGVVVKQEKVMKVAYKEAHFELETLQGQYKAEFVLGAYGKRDQLDRLLNRSFFQRPAPWVGIKAHYLHKGFPDDLVELHHFKGGYCGLSRTESGAVNLCYLAHYNSFKKHPDPGTFLQESLGSNPYLKSFLREAEPLFDRPLSIGQVSFSKKEPVKDHIVMIGDTAGLIHPLCGNGMAMAIGSARIAANALLEQIRNKSRDRVEFEKQYQHLWKKEFSNRLMTGKWLQRIIMDARLSALSHHILSRMPFLLPHLIRKTHGKAT